MNLLLFQRIVTETLKGKDLARVLMNYATEKLPHTLKGNIIDLGSGSDKSSYYRFLKFKKPYLLTFTDYYKTGPNIKKLNLEKAFNLPANSYNHVLCFNTIPLINNTPNIYKQVYKILKKGGLFIGTSDFLIKIHPDPNDYYRFTQQKLEELGQAYGFKNTKIIPVGFGPFVASYYPICHLFPKFIQIIFSTLAIFLDSFLIKLKPSWGESFPLSYLFIYQK